MPSLMEGFGLPPLEAMANDCLVIASAIPSLLEICDNAALYFDPKSVSEMASKMHEALSLTAELKGSMIVNGEKRAKQFSWRKMAEDTVQIYKSCASKDAV
jgi:glycosyltransferase involved in cell wall biosynthesis